MVITYNQLLNINLLTLNKPVCCGIKMSRCIKTQPLMKHDLNVTNTILSVFNEDGVGGCVCVAITHQAASQGVQPLYGLFVVHNTIHSIHKQHDLTESWEQDSRVYCAVHVLKDLVICPKAFLFAGLIPTSINFLLQMAYLAKNVQNPLCYLNSACKMCGVHG